MPGKLASIERILELKDHPNGDNLSICKVKGWQVIIGRNEYSVNSLVVFVEIDTILPDRPEFKFLEPRGYRIRSIRLRKELSQGIIFPLAILYPYISSEYGTPYFVEGQDVTEIIGAIHYVKPIPASMAGKVEGDFPTSIVHKTDEHRLQNFPELIKEFWDKLCFISLKINGTSSTFLNRDGEIKVCSRNLSLKEDEDNIYWKMFKKYDLEKVLKDAGNYCVQGEIYGNGIMKNPLNIPDIDLAVFNVYDIGAGRYLDFMDFVKFCTKYKIKTVPILQSNVPFNWTMEQLLEMAKGKYDGTNNHREGIVIRPMQEFYSEVLRGRASVKCLNNNYLVKEGE